MKSVQSLIRAVALLMVAAVVVALAQNSYSFVINGKASKLETTEKNGKVFVETQSFARALGLSVQFDKNKKTFVIAGDAATASATNPAQGTTQLAGGAGEFGKAYTIGKDSPINFTLRSAEFSVVRQILREPYVPKAEQKLLILHFTVQNPNKADLNFGYSNLVLNVVDDQGVTSKFDAYVAREGSTDELNAPLKPAQKIDAYTVWPVAGNAKIPKLIVQSPDNHSPVVRYDLSGKIKPLAAPFADPKDNSGSSALANVPAQANTYYPMGLLDIRFESASFSGDPMDKRPPEEGRRYFVATFSVKNQATKETNYSYSTFKIQLTDEEGNTVLYNEYILRPTRDEHADGTLQPGAETKFRVFFALPKEVGAKTISISELNYQSRAYVYDVSAVK